MKASDIIFRLKELVHEINSKLPHVTDSSAVENIQRIAELTRLSSEMHQRFIMIETLIHKESGFQNDQNAAMRNFLKELKQVVAVSKNEDKSQNEFIQFVQPNRTVEEEKPLVKEEPDQKPEPIKVQEPIKTETPVPIVEAIPVNNVISNKPINLAINDRFRIMNELFLKQAHKLDEHLQLLNGMDKSAALSHWRSLSQQFNWDEELDIVKTFKSVIFNRYA
jgi:hypothetical protein